MIRGRHNVRLQLVLILGLMPACAARSIECDTRWLGDESAIGVRVVCDGIVVTTFSGSPAEQVLRYLHDETTCYSEGEGYTVIGRGFLNSSIRLPSGEHDIELVGPDGKRLRFRATIGDSDQFWVYWKCPAVFYPDGSGGHRLATLP